jgi:hypothetical protein
MSWNSKTGLKARKLESLEAKIFFMTSSFPASKLPGLPPIFFPWYLKAG